MINYYLKQGWRRIFKKKSSSLLNMVGLAAGLASFAFISVWVKDEWTKDKFNKNYDRILRVVGTAKTETGIEESAVSSAPMAAALKNDYPEIEETVRFDMDHDAVAEHNNQKFLEKELLFADPSFFKIFSFHLSEGDPATALADPFSLILTRSTAIKYFGNEHAIGKTLTLYLNDTGTHGALYKVTGIMPDVTENSHFKFNVLGSFSTVEKAHPDVLTTDGWGDASYYTYVLLKKGTNAQSLSLKIRQFYGKYIGNLWPVWKPIYSYKLQPLSDIHLRSHLKYEIFPTGNITNVYIFSSIGIFILLLAGINYMNLATAQSVRRAREVGIKKVAGAAKRQLIIQYLFEAILTSLLGLVLAFAICLLLQPAFSQLTGKDISPFSSPSVILFMTAVAVILGALSSIYPALVLSGFQAVSVLKGSFQTGVRGVWLRKSLVTAQFTITILLVSGIIVIHSQMKFIKNKDLGFNKEELVFFRVHGNTDVINGFVAFKNKLLLDPAVRGVSVSNSLPVGGLGSGGAETVDADGRPIQVNTARLRIDQDYLNVYGIKLLAGNDFDLHSASDSIQPFILNLAAIRKFGWKDAATAIGKPFKMGDAAGTVRGVVRNFHFNSLQEAIEPLAIYPIGERFSRITVKVDMKNAGQAIASLKDAWKKQFPSALLDFEFLDAQLGFQYKAEQRFSKIFLYFSVLSLMIACLGLYGLISYAASQRTKEIGLRKVLGGTATGIAILLSRDFLKLVIVGIVIATPLAWYVMNNWLQDFAYRISISWWMFAAAGTSVLFVALCTVGFRAMRAAITNPINALRTE